MLCAYVLVLGRAILRTQLLDIDLRLRRGIGAGTVAGVYVVMFVAASEAARAWLSPAAAPLGGLAAAGLLLLALAHVQRFARRVQDAALPG